MLIVHVLYDCGDAMGANLINTACEALTPRIELLTGGRVNLRILSNLSDRCMAWARCRLPPAVLSNTLSLLNDSTMANARFSAQQFAHAIASASVMAQLDLYAASAHNRSVCDAIDAIAIATGNDWRALEAGAHAYAARDGRYSPLAVWRIDEQNNLLGGLEMPLAVGIVGGATRTHPTARAILQRMDVRTARELSEVMACAGLASHLARIITQLA
jgi:hydroxymethylglutaryl-CoA reductase